MSHRARADGPDRRDKGGTPELLQRAAALSSED
eukprot:COSAG03_NODE_7313_length_936_cov_0.677419_2_plen_32_part_01